MLPLKILSLIFSIHHCSLAILYFALLFHILLCAKKKNTKSETASIKKNANLKRIKTITVADKNVAPGADDVYLINRVPQIPPNDVEVNDKSLQSDEGVATNLLNLPLATPASLALAGASGANKKTDKEKQNSVASTILLSISKQLIAHPSDMKSGDEQRGLFWEEEQTQGEHAQKIEETQRGQKIEHTDNVEKVGKVRKLEQVEKKDHFEKIGEAQKSKKLEDEEKIAKVKQIEKAEAKGNEIAPIEQTVVPLERTQSEKKEQLNSTPESSTQQSNKIQLLSTQSTSFQAGLTQTTDIESSKASTQSSPSSKRSPNIGNSDANFSNRNISLQKILAQRMSQFSKRSKKSSKGQDDKTSIKRYEELPKKSSKDSRSGKFSAGKNRKSTALQNELQRGAILDQADRTQWHRVSPTPNEEASLQPSSAHKEIEKMQSGSVAKEHEKMPQGSPQRRLANAQWVPLSMRAQPQASVITQSGKEMRPLYLEMSKDSMDSATSNDGFTSEAQSDAQLMNSLQNTDDMQLHIQALPTSHSKHEATSFGNDALQSSATKGHTDIQLELPTKVEQTQPKVPEEGKSRVSCYLQLR